MPYPQFDRSSVAMQPLSAQDNKFDFQEKVVLPDREPPEDNPAYYLRYNKTFSRMGGTLNYLQADNRDFLLTLTRQLEKLK